MDATQFLLLNAAIVIGLVAFFLMGGRRGGRLKFRNNTRLPQVPRRPTDEAPPLRNEKALNCFFMFNGHSFDAFEVLGVPAGAGWAEAERAYQDAVRRNPKSRDLFETALNAIRNRS